MSSIKEAWKDSSNGISFRLQFVGPVIKCDTHGILAPGHHRAEDASAPRILCDVLYELLEIARPAFDSILLLSGFRYI